MNESFQRKEDHIDLCHTGDVGFKSHQGLFDQVTLIHNALPELAMDEIQLETKLIASTLAAPVMMTGMTGGPERAGVINRDLAVVAESLGIAFGVGSQRVLLKAPEAAATFDVRRHAPNVVLIGNIGVNQARHHGVEAVRDLMDRIDANYLAIHLNAAMELVQPGAEADSDFRDGYDTIARLVDALDGKVLVKECGSGLSPQVVKRLDAIGVQAMDVSGSGGTSWVKVEALRAAGELAALGDTFAEWGIPTIAATTLARRVTTSTIIASGGIDNGLKAGIALAMGADIVGAARPVLQAYLDGGVEGASAWLNTLIKGIRMTIALTGARSVAELRRSPRIIGPELDRWIDQGALDEPMRSPASTRAEVPLRFEDLERQSPGTIQTVLQHVEMQTLVTSLTGVHQDFEAKILGSMSDQAGHTMKTKLGLSNAVPKRLVDEARHQVSQLMRALEAGRTVSFVREERTSVR
ncbi:MAG: type 2 isopentenyl-diphosphate Delta-isomerase [Myxococcota bacterium]|nr:type 2 isopentenyl-diphosphate Delta-isomerase [Myxococcota bacterium]